MPGSGGFDTLTNMDNRTRDAKDDIPVDLYALSEDAIREPPQSLGQALLKIGPGLILAGAIVGTGELIATTNVGAKVGFALLWLVIVSCVIKIFVQIELGRYAISSGETTLVGLRRLPGPGVLLPWWWLVMMLATQAQLAAMVGSIGQAIHIAVSGVSTRLAEQIGLGAQPELPWAALTAVLAAVLLAAGSYRVVEWGTTLLVVIFTLMTVLCVVLLPWTGHYLSWRDIASGLLFHIPSNAVGPAVAMFGITGVGASELIAYPYWCIEKGYARNIGPHSESEDWARRARGWLRVMHLDAWVSMMIYTVATLAFYLLGAAVLHGYTGPEGLPGTVSGMLHVLSRMYVPVMGERIAVWFIVIGAFAVLFSTLFAATAANCRTLTDLLAIHRLIRLTNPGDRTRWVRRFCVGFPIFNFFLFLWAPNPVRLVTIGGFAQALTLPMIATAAVYLRYRRTDRRITPGLAWDIFLWLSMLGLFATALYGVWDSYKTLLG